MKGKAFFKNVEIARFDFPALLREAPRDVCAQQDCPIPDSTAFPRDHRL